jgi:hypothetical protein
MNTRTIARDWAEEARHSLSERIARFAMAINGCSAQDVSQSDWGQAKRELTSEPDTNPKEAVLESAPDSKRWHPVPGSTGNKLMQKRTGETRETVENAVKEASSCCGK